MRIIRTIVWIIGLGLSLSTLLGYMGCCWIPLDLFSHFRFHYILLLLPVIAFFIWKKQWWAVVLFGTTLFINTLSIAPLFYYNTPTKVENTLGLYSINVNYFNDEYEKVIGEISQKKVDVIVFQEYTPAWHLALSTLKNQYPYESHIFKENNFGLAVWSRYPINDTLVHYFADINTPTLEVSIKKETHSINLLAFHPPAPVSNRFGPYATNQVIGALSDYIKLNSHLPQIVIGDFNATPYSYPFVQLLKETNLQNSQIGFGLQHSWGGPLASMGISIDHCLHSSDMQTLSREIGPYVGSDHRGLWVELRY